MDSLIPFALPNREKRGSYEPLDLGNYLASPSLVFPGSSDRFKQLGSKLAKKKQLLVLLR